MDKSFIISNTNNDDLHIQNLCSNYSVSHICSLKQNVNTYSKKSPFFKRQLLFRRDQNSISILQPTISADEMSSALFSNSCQKIQMTVECRIPVRNDFVCSVGNSLFFISCFFLWIGGGRFRGEDYHAEYEYFAKNREWLGRPVVGQTETVPRSPLIL